MLKTAPIRQKKCKSPDCGEKFTPRNSLQMVCSPLCALAYNRAKAAKARRRQNREAKDKLKTRRDLTKEAQVAFNAYIRERDRDEPCICCGQFGNDESWKPGGQWDCGHFLSVGSHPELRFEPLNAHKQLKSCNAGAGRFTRKNRTVSQEYEERLRKKIGDEAVDWLKGPHEPKKYTAFELREIKKYWLHQKRELIKQRLKELEA